MKRFDLKINDFKLKCVETLVLFVILVVMRSLVLIQRVSCVVCRAARR